jgi:hypothetical protein
MCNQSINISFFLKKDDPLLNELRYKMLLEEQKLRRIMDGFTNEIQNFHN